MLQIARDFRGGEQFVNPPRFGEALVGAEYERRRELHVYALAEEMPEMRRGVIERLMSGNVWEWTHSEYKKYPFDPEAKLEKIKDTNIHRVLRGGAFYFDERSVRCACRDGSILDDWFSDVGFRVVVSPLS